MGDLESLLRRFESSYFLFAKITVSKLLRMLWGRDDAFCLAETVLVWQRRYEMRRSHLPGVSAVIRPFSQVYLIFLEQL